MDKLLLQAPSWEFCGGTYPGPSYDIPKEEGPPEEYGTEPRVVERESPLLVAAKMGVEEMVDIILKYFPFAIGDVNQDGKNAVLLAAENRQSSVYKLLMAKFGTKGTSYFRQVDRDGNSVLHLAATCKPGLMPGGALKMHSEMKWYQFIKETLPTKSIRRLNNKGQTDEEVFIETHKDLVKAAGDWLNNTSSSCSLVATLIASVAFTTATATPGSDQKHDQGGGSNSTAAETKALGVFSIASLIAQCFSYASLIVFLSIITSRYEEDSFYGSLIGKLIFGLTSLFISMASILVSFFASIWFVFKHHLNIPAFPLFGITCLPIAFAAATLIPLYKYLIASYFYKRPR
ncbi:hypothetical protein ACLOJK_026768 [Asimina triloba]